MSSPPPSRPVSLKPLATASDDAGDDDRRPAARCGPSACSCRPASRSAAGRSARRARSASVARRGAHSPSDAGERGAHVGRRLAQRGAVGQRHRAVALGQPRAVGAEHERHVGVARAPASPSRAPSHSWRGVESSRSAPRTTSPMPWSASSTTTARL